MDIYKYLQKNIHYLRNNIEAKKYHYLDRTCIISKKANIYGKQNISIDAFTHIYENATLLCGDPLLRTKPIGKIHIGKNAHLLPYSYINSYEGQIIIGDNFSLNPYSILYGNGGLEIGNNVRIAAHCVLVSANHVFESRSVPIFLQGMTGLGIKINDDVWLGAGVYVLDGVVIETGCVVGAGSVVTKPTEPFGVYVGNPARRIKDRK